MAKLEEERTRMEQKRLEDSKTKRDTEEQRLRMEEEDRRKKKSKK